MAIDARNSGFTALSGLLEEFRRRNITALPAERDGMEKHTRVLSAGWNDRFPDFPTDYFPYTSFRGEFFRSRRDGYLKDLIVKLLADREPAGSIIVNPACVFGRHACDLAARLKRFRVIGTDIDPSWNRIYRLVRGFRIPENFSFVVDDIFEPALDVLPTAVVFFGACGALSDAAMDYAISSGAPFLMCRTCCHDNIGGNVEIARRSSTLNRFFRFKNRVYGRMKVRARYAGYYFSEKYPPSFYPRSEAGKAASTPDEFQEVARHSTESDICRTIIDLDRYLGLVEKGYRVLYQGELFVAERCLDTAHPGA